MLRLKEENIKLKNFVSSPTTDVEKLLQENKKLKIDIQKIKSYHYDNEDTNSININYINSPVSRADSNTNLSINSNNLTKNLSNNLSSNLSNTSQHIKKDSKDSNYNCLSISLLKSSSITSSMTYNTLTADGREKSNNRLTKSTELPIYTADRNDTRILYNNNYENPNTMKRVGESIILGLNNNKYGINKNNSSKELNPIKSNSVKHFKSISTNNNSSNSNHNNNGNSNNKKEFFLPSERLKMFEEYEIKMSKKLENERLNIQNKLKSQSKLPILDTNIKIPKISQSYVFSSSKNINSIHIKNNI